MAVLGLLKLRRRMQGNQYAATCEGATRGRWDRDEPSTMVSRGQRDVASHAVGGAGVSHVASDSGVRVLFWLHRT